MKDLYFVEEGDTIASIAQNVNMRAGDILEYNRIEAENILPGVALVINKIEGKRYIVKPFDTIAKIALANNISVESIRKHNNIKEVFLGQIIFLPTDNKSK